MNRKPEDMAAVFINEVAFRSAKWSWYIFFPPKNPSPENDEINRANWRGKIFLSFFFFSFVFSNNFGRVTINRVYNLRGIYVSFQLGKTSLKDIPSNSRLAIIKDRNNFLNRSNGTKMKRNENDYVQFKLKILPRQ